MLIDWFTVCAQALNFLILVWLLRRFLYRPILDAIDAREKKIAAQLADAHAKMAEAKKEREEFLQKNEEFDKQRAALMSKASEEAADERKRLIDAAQKDSDGLRVKERNALRTEHERLGDEITRRAGQEVFAIARKTLTDLASVSLEERMVEVLVARMHALNVKESDALKLAFKASAEGAVVRSSFELPAAQRKSIENAIKEKLAIDHAVRYETAPDLVSGIEISAHGWKIAWTITDYLESLEQGIGELLKA